MPAFYIPHNRQLTYSLATLVLSLVIVTATLTAKADGWLQFRGNKSQAVSDTTGLPVTFDATTNVAWRAPLPGRGPSSPIIVGNLVIVTADSSTRNDRLHVIAMDKSTGKQRWHRQLWATGHTVIHEFGGVAANTPASDEKHIVAMFSSNDVACFDIEGNLCWMRGLAFENPTMRNDVGMASSPLIVGDHVIVQCENQGESFVAGLNLKSGATDWQLPRGNDAIWSSPTLLAGEEGDRPLVLLTGRDGLSCVEPDTGQIVWQYEASSNTVASATTDGRDIYFPANGIHHLRYDPNIRGVEMLWYEQRLRGGNPSPVVRDGKIYVIKSPTILACADTETGKILWQVRMKGNQFWSTPVIAGNTIYVAPHDGLIHAIDISGDKGEILGTSQIEQGVLATPAIDSDAIYFRTNEHLWKVSENHSTEN